MTTGSAPENLPVRTAEHLVSELQAAALEGIICGDSSAVADHPANLPDGGRHALCFYTGTDPDRIAHLRDCILICLPDLKSPDTTVTRILTNHPRLAFAVLMQAFAPPLPPPGIHPTAVIDPEAKIDPSAHIGPYCVLETCEIGAGTVLFSHVTVFSKTRIGRDTIIEPHACIGQFGHGFEWGPDNRRWVMPQLGGTVIGDHCYVGASSVISRGALQDTILENHVRVAENSLVGHNSHLKWGAFVANGVSMAGMTTVGRRCWIGTGSSLCNQITLGDNVTVGAGAVVTEDFVEGNLVLVGVPAKVLRRCNPIPGLTEISEAETR